MNLAHLDHELIQKGWSLVEGVRNEPEHVELANHLGKIVRPPQRSWKQLLEPTPVDVARPSTYSARLGRARFPYHTDYANWIVPPRYVVLRNAGRATNAATLLRDPRSELAEDDDLRKLLSRGIFYARFRGRSFLCRVLARRCGKTLLRWDRFAMCPANELAVRVAERLNERLPREQLESRVTWKRRRALVVDNWRVLHGRESVEAAPGRRLERILVR